MRKGLGTKVDIQVGFTNELQPRDSDFRYQRAMQSGSTIIRSRCLLLKSQGMATLDFVVQCLISTWYSASQVRLLRFA